MYISEYYCSETSTVNHVKSQTSQNQKRLPMQTKKSEKGNHLHLNSLLGSEDNIQLSNLFEMNMKQQKIIEQYKRELEQSNKKLEPKNKEIA
jgi:dTDP-4-amino-4,6-dideoxygalactose transaminase